MKKKGLIISTVVMVVVLIASLTTATYAWFTVQATTTIDGFNLSVVSNNILNIGLKTNNTYDAAASADAFVSGSCTYTGTAGALGGTWTGDPGMAASIEHNITYGDVSTAVGVTSATDKASATQGNTTVFPASLTDKLIIAAQKGEGSNLTQTELAVANGYNDGTTDLTADFAYLFLGASPTKAIEPGTNKLYIVVQSTGNGQTIGISSALHVAYRLNGASDWTDKDVFGNVHYAALRSATNATVPFDASASTDVTGTYAEDTKVTTFNGAAVLSIDLRDLSIGEIDQLELVIYLAGSDTDCIDAAKGVTVNVGIFFGAQAKTETTGA